jgi:hypothetical protein
MNVMAISVLRKRLRDGTETHEKTSLIAVCLAVCRPAAVASSSLSFFKNSQWQLTGSYERVG